MTYVEDQDDAEESASSSRRIWKRRDGSQGSSQLALAAMAVLYDAGQPLTRDQIVERLWPRLDDYARAYLQAWYARYRDQQNRNQRRARGTVNVKFQNITLTAGIVSLRRWVNQVFAPRAKTGHTLIQHPDGRYEPGPRAPFLTTMEGARVRYTPEVRRDVEQADQQNGRLHLIQLEVKRAVATLPDQSPVARAQAFRFLVRQLYGGASKGPLNAWDLRRAFDHLLQVADTRETQDAAIRQVTEWLLTGER